MRLLIDRQQRVVIARSTERGGDYTIQADFGGSPNTTTTAQVAAREEAAAGLHQRATTSTEQNMQFDPSG